MCTQATKLLSVQLNSLCKPLCNLFACVQYCIIRSNYKYYSHLFTSMQRNYELQFTHAST